ncbi:MAG: hypothetical protein K8R48_09915 [Alphaproteobacteria bacterium]|nr:hypothetical protein [Alphaproteobacteria bacterium]
MEKDNINAHDIYLAYLEEYSKKHAAERKGFWGAVNRFFMKFDKPAGDTAGRVLFPAIGVGSLALLGVSSVVVIPLLFGVMALGGAAYIVVDMKAINLLNRDIADGKLTQRYVEEVLKPRQEELQRQIDTLSKLEKGGLSGAFDAKVAETAKDNTSNATKKLIPPQL